jgi:RNA 3'-terminal phosphate cyclase (ATP)
MNLAEIDGSQGEGGGQILRTSVSLSCILGIPIKIRNIRALRKEPGLRPQHLQAVLSAAEISNSKIVGAKVGSSSIELYPGEPSKCVSKTVDTRTAGSVTLIAQTLIPIGIFRNLELDIQIIGGTEVPASPTIDYLQQIVLPVYRKIGADVQILLKRRGYYPKGGGIIQVKVKRSSTKNHSVKFPAIEDLSSPVEASIIASSSLLPSHVTQREVESASSVLSKNRIQVKDAMTYDRTSAESAFSPGTSISIFRQNENECIGASSLGERGKRAEEVGSQAAQQFVKEIQGRPNFDSHLADMAVTLFSCIPHKSSFTTSLITKHLETNLQVAAKMTGMSYKISETGERGIYSVELFPVAEKSI